MTKFVTITIQFRRIKKHLIAWFIKHFHFHSIFGENKVLVTYKKNLLLKFDYNVPTPKL
jgi:hypothetical protein